MDFNIEIRRKQLENLNQFVSSSKDRVESILEYLGWSGQKITENQKEMVKCLVNPQHRIAAAGAGAHMQNCAWRKEKYAVNDVPLSEPHFIPGSSLVIDDLTKVNVLNSALALNPMMKTGWRPNEPVPKTSNRLLATFTPDERLALYEFSAASTKGPPEVPEFNLNEPKQEKKQNLTSADREKLERDAKRRRIKYKTKSVHTNRKSMTEILRELIEYQMDMYEDWLNDDGTTKSDDAKPPEVEEDVIEQNSSPAGSASPRSSRSQTSYESRHNRRVRSRSRERRYRSRSRSRKRDEYRREYSSRNRFDDNSSRDFRDPRNYDRDGRSLGSRDRSDPRRNRSDRSRNRSER